MKIILLTLVLSLLLASVKSSASTLFDKERNRHVPVNISLPTNPVLCREMKPCPVAFISSGYGIEHGQYRFLSDKLNNLGYLVVAIGHERPGDPPLSVTGNFYETRQENWQRGARTLEFVREKVKQKYQNYDTDAIVLIGHSNGGDISALLANQAVRYIDTLITLDHRRVPLPRHARLNILSIRGSDYPADEGVLPSKLQAAQLNMCIHTITNARHNDMADYGPTWLKENIAELVSGFLQGKQCPL